MHYVLRGNEHTISRNSASSYVHDASLMARRIRRPTRPDYTARMRVDGTNVARQRRRHATGIGRAEPRTRFVNHRDVLGLALLALLGAAKPARGFHRQTPPIVAITGSGDNHVPRLNQGLRITLAIDPSDLFPDGYWKPPPSAAGNGTVVV